MADARRGRLGLVAQDSAGEEYLLEDEDGELMDESDDEYVIEEDDGGFVSPAASDGGTEDAGAALAANADHSGRVEGEFAALRSGVDVSSGRMMVRKSGSSEDKWVVGLARFGEDCEGGAALDVQLNQHAMLHADATGMVELEVRFPPEFPSAPPTLRVVKPIFEPHCSGLDMGALAMPLLYAEGWQKRFTMDAVLRWVRAHLVRAAPRVRLTTNSHYSMEAYLAAADRLARRVDMPKVSAMATNKGFILMSRTFAITAGIMTSFSPKFETSDKVELPGHILQTMTQDSILGTQALTFEIASPAGVRVYAGASFSSPEDNLIIAPDWLWASLHVPQCCEVHLRPVELPRAIAVKLAAVSSRFAALDVDHSMLLQSALQNYTTLAPGTTVPVQAFDETHHFLITGTTPDVAAVCPWVGSHFMDLGIKFGSVIASDSDVGALGAAGAGGTSIPPAPPLTHQLSAGSAGTGGMPPVPALGPRLPSYQSGGGGDGTTPAGRWTTPGTGGAAATGAGGAAAPLPLSAQPSGVLGAASAAAAVHDAERAAFAEWRRQQEESRDQVALAAAAGQRVQPWDETAPRGKVKVQLFNPLDDPALPPAVTLLVNTTTSLRALHAHLEEGFAPPHVPFDLFLRGRVPPTLTAAVGDRGNAGNPRQVPALGDVTVGQAGLLGKVLEQRLRPKLACDKTAALVSAYGAPGRAGRAQDPEVAAAWAAVQAGEDFGPVSTYVVNGGVVGLSARYDCGWLRQLQRADVPALQLGAGDLHLLKKDVVLENLGAELI